MQQESRRVNPRFINKSKNTFKASTSSLGRLIKPHVTASTRDKYMVVYLFNKHSQF